MTRKDQKKGIYSDPSIPEAATIYLPQVRHREANPRGPGREQGQHARLQEREEDRHHPEHVRRERLDL